MATQIKHLAFKGIEKKEQILFKSFLNLAKNELEYQIVVLKGKRNEENPDILICDETYQFSKGEHYLQVLPRITIGENIDNENIDYILRPVQWSDFKTALGELDISRVEKVTDDENIQRVLPRDIKFAINKEVTELTDDSELIDFDSFVEQDQSNKNFELGGLSVDDNSFTNTEFIHAADDVQGFNQLHGSKTIEEAVVLLSDDESSSVNSVVVIETNEFDAWHFTESETTEGFLHNDSVIVTEEEEADDHDENEIVLEQKVGLKIKADEEYWADDNEIIIDHETFFFIKPERSMIYCATEPGYWSQILIESELSKLPIETNWQPASTMKAYPLEYLYWVNAITFETTKLASPLEENGEFILMTWPKFDLVEMDNDLLKLCTMLFVRPRGVQTLIAKSGCEKAKVIGLINACHRIGLIQTAEEFEQGDFSPLITPDGVFDKFKGALGVFGE